MKAFNVALLRVRGVIRWVADQFSAYMRLSPRWHIALTIVPPLCVLLFLIFFHVDIPYQDQWDSEWYRIQRAITGNLTLNDLWTQNNEHRPLAPTLIWIPLAIATRWSILAEVLVGLLLTCATFTLLIYQASRVMRELGVSQPSAVFPLLSIVFFSLNQWENWLFGFSIQAFLHVLAVTLGALLLVHPARRWWRLAVVALCGVIATYSMLNGLLFWAIGLAVLIVDVRRRARPLGAALFWVLCAIVVAASYFYQFHPSAAHPSVLTALHDPLGYVLYVLTLLGAPLMTFYTAGIMGLLGLVALVWSMVLLFRVTGLRPFIFFILLAAYSLLSVLMIGVGRVGFGWKLALSPRYVTLVIGAWLAVIVFLYCLAVLPRSLGTHDGMLRSVFKASLAMIAALAIVCCAGGAYLGYTMRYRPIIEVRQAILAGDVTDEMLKRLHPNPAQVRTQLELLRKYRLSLYRDVQP